MPNDNTSDGKKKLKCREGLFCLLKISPLNWLAVSYPPTRKLHQVRVVLAGKNLPISPLVVHVSMRGVL